MPGRCRRLFSCGLVQANGRMAGVSTERCHQECLSPKYLPSTATGYAWQSFRISRQFNNYFIDALIVHYDVNPLTAV